MAITGKTMRKIAPSIEITRYLFLTDRNFLFCLSYLFNSSSYVSPFLPTKYTPSSCLVVMNEYKVESKVPLLKAVARAVANFPRTALTEPVSPLDDDELLCSGVSDIYIIIAPKMMAPM